MKVAVPAESIPGERRVAMTPEALAPLIKAGLDVAVQSGAGLHALASDNDYRDAGASVVGTVEASFVDVLLHVRPLHPRVINRLAPGAITIGFCSPASEDDSVRALCDARITSFAMELVPRISRAQSMDALTSQALVAGYRCVLEGAMRLPRFLPLFMTAAGTIPPAKVLVLGAGVAGLQAIATAKRLGAQVSAYDVRAASADEVKSMGGTFIDLGLEVAEGTGGYAREQSEDRGRRQQEALAPFVAAADLVVTTAAIPGRRAPQLITRPMVERMKPGAVLVDLAAEGGGNIEGSIAGLDVHVEVDGGVVVLVGMKDAASTMPADASRLYAKNVANLLLLMTKDGEVVPDFSDEVVAGTCLTHRGGIVHAQTALGMGEPAADPTPSESPPEKPRVTPPETPAAPTEGAAS